MFTEVSTLPFHLSRYSGGVLAFLVLINICICVALDVRINEDTLIGEELLNSGLNPLEKDWRYNIDSWRSTAWINSIFKVNTTTGQVTLKKKLPPCDPRRPQHHGTLYIEASSSKLHSFVRLPINVYVDDQCRIHNRHKTRTLRSLNVAIFIAPTSHELCFEPETAIASVQQYIPSVLQKGCTVSHSIATIKHFLCDSDMSISTDRFVCITPSTVIARGTITSVCNSETVSLPIKLILKSSSKFLVSSSYKLSKANRVRRQSYDAPTFEEPVYIFEVDEEQSPGFRINYATISDANTRDVTYSMLANRNMRSQNMFTIDSATGEIKTAVTLDREDIPVHYFQVRATDAVNTYLTGTANLNIMVNDINDHSPAFEQPIYRTEVLEGHGSRNSILTLRAIDEDEGANSVVQYSILNHQGNNEIFEIDPYIGSITATSDLDRESIGFYTLQIQATDMSTDPSQRKMTTATVEITVTDANDNKPQFSQSSYTFEVAENIDNDFRHVIGEIRATDQDEGMNAMIQYSITGGNTRQVFHIDSVSGQLFVEVPLDYEDKTDYRLQIKAQDSGSPPKSNSTQVLVRVRDMNDNEPHFSSNHQVESVHENVPIGYTIVSMQGLDRDSGPNGQLVYSIDPDTSVPPNLPILINRDTGIITTSQKLDRETYDIYQFTVLAKDQGTPSRTGSTEVEIRVLDVNDNAPIFDPRVYSASVSEEEHEGYSVITVTATDADTEAHSRISYTISSGNVRGAFRITKQGGLGRIMLTKQLNYRTENHYILTITATDSGDQLDTATVYVNVTDANNHRPIFSNGPYLMRVHEDVKIGTGVFRVTATDNDIGENARITYTLEDNEVFTINPVTGNITVKENLDRERAAGYALSVTAEDHGHPPRSDTTDIEVIVLDVNDNSPIFEQTSYLGRVDEDAIIGTSVLTIRAVDSDESLNGRIRYSFENGFDGNGDFMLDPTLGILRTGQELDRERLSSYELKAYAIDRGSPELSTSVMIRILVQDVNDNAPQFESQRLNLKINENSPIGSTVDRVTAVDPDDSVNAQVRYSIVGGPDAESFSLITEADQTAVILTQTELDFESGKTSYILTLRAQSDHLLSDVLVIIDVVDINDNQPQLQDFSIVFNNFHGYFPTGDIGRIPARDPDVNDHLRYSFISGNTANYLHLDATTGMIRLHSKLNSDVPANASLHVAVTGKYSYVNIWLTVGALTTEHKWCTRYYSW